MTDKPIIRSEAWKNRNHGDKVYPELLDKSSEEIFEDYKMLVNIDEIIQLVKYMEEKVDADSNMSLPGGKNSSEEQYAKSYLTNIRRSLEKAKKEEVVRSE